MSDILGSLFELGTAFADVAVDTIGDVVNATRSGFLRQPRSIKRALEWIACCCSNENRNSLEKALKKLPGFSDNSNIKDLLQKLGGDTPDGIYANAKWEDLCKNTQGGTNCCASTGGKGGCSGCKGSGKSCDGCCYDCPQIICARMFCLILPIVYYFLEYLIKFDEKAKNNSNDTELKKLLSACGFVTDDMDSVDGSGSNTKLKELLKAINKVKEALKKGCNNADSQQSSLATTAHKEGAKEPKTIRDMMLWLQGLPYCPQFHELTKKIREKCEKLQGRNNNGVTCEKVLENLFDTACRLPGMFLTVEGTSSYFMKDLMEGCLGYTNEQCFMYKENGEELLKQFCEYTYKVHTQLRYLMNMCSYGNENGGWWQCILRHEANGQGNARSNPVKCKCKGYAANGCSQPLKAFLNQNKTSAQGTSDADHNIPMGFDRHNPSRTLFNGWDLYYLIKELIDPINTSSPTTPSKPLSLLTQYCVAIGQLQPQSLGDLFAFFAHLGQSWETLGLYGQNGDTFKQKLETELNGYKIGNGGEQESCDELEKKIKAIIPTTHSSHSNDRSLMSLMCTNNTNNASGRSNGCTPYMKSLSQGVYHYYQLGVEYQQNQFHLLQYLYDMLRKLLDGMKALKEAFDKCECCKNTSTCQGLISCPNAHPILYKFGFVFGSPERLKTGTKKCETLKDQLDAVLSCAKDNESALFSAFECVIQVTYKVLLDKAKGIVHGTYKTDNGGSKTGGLKSTNQEMNRAFTLYVENAMYQSYPKLICTFACKVFKEDHKCEGDTCKNRFKKQIAEPKPRIPDSKTSPITVSPSAVTSISAVIPQYTAPVIDRYHYRAFQKTIAQTGGSQPGQKSDGSTHYSFKDALDFHVSGANCIRPTPVALRSVIDWMLRVTVGAIATQDGNTNGNNDNIKGLSEAIKSVFRKDGVSVNGVNNTDVQQHIVSLVKGLRTFMGYKDKSGEVISKVGEALGTNGTNGVKGALKKNIEALNNFIGSKGSPQFASELGKALLKGQYAFKQTDALETLVDMAATFADTLLGIDNKKNIHVRKNFKDAVKTFSDILESEHEGCKDLKCTTLQSNGSQSNDQNDGLQTLKEFLEAVAKFNQWTYEIGDGYNNKSSSDIVLRMRQSAEKTVSGTAMNGTNGDKYLFYNKLVTALATLGGCTHLVEDLMKQNGSDTSSAYRTKIQALINKLNEVLEALKINNGAKKDIPLDKVESANQALITRTKSNVENRIKWEIQEGVEGKYTQQNGNCSASHTQHSTLQDYICIQSLITLIEGAINSKCDLYKSHLDDLKALCQWLYRMGQLYAHGLKGFVESLIEHLKHIVQVIKWIEGIQKMMTKLKDISQESEALQVDGLNGDNDIKNCCSSHNGLYNDTKFTDRDGFFTALNCRIERLLGSYVLGPLPEGSNEQQDDKTAVATRIKFLLELRLLALDRYTLQVWQDECNPKDSRPSTIKDWITFKDGIVKHSDLNAIKEKLHDLTGITFGSNITPVSSTPAPASASRSRIHDFHAICVIQKFSYEAPIAKLQRSLEKLEGIKDMLEGVKEKCDGGTDVSSDTVVTSFCTAVREFLKEPYGIYSFAKFLHTILGPNIFSAVIGALEELKDKDQYKNGDGKLDKIKGILGVMTEGLESDTENRDHYKLEKIIEKIESFISTLRREYIFAYPVVTANKASVPAATQPNPQPTIPKCNNDDHSMSSICKHCHPYLARIFIGAIPNLYRHCRLLYEMCKLDVNKKTCWRTDRLTFTKNGVYAYNDFYLSLGGYMSRNGWIVKGYNKEMDKKELYELDPNGGGSSIYGNLYDVVSSIYPLEESNKDSLKPLDQLFKAVMQHFKEERKKKIDTKHQALKAAFETKYKDSGLKFQAPLPQLPSTVRQVLFWLHELDTNKAFYDDMSQHIKALCTKSTIPISHDSILHVLKLSATQALEVLSTIEDPGRQNAQYLYELYTEEHYYAYPTVNIPLFFYTFVEKLMGAFLELNFVCVQCEFRALEGGWKDCEIGNEQGSQGDDTKKEALCKCQQQTAKAPATNNCPRPLSAFLFSDPKNQLSIPGDVSQRLAYMSKGTMPCGFQLKNKAITDAATPSPAHTPAPTSVSGSVLVETLRKLVGGHVTGRLNDTEQNTLRQVIYLRDLLRYVLCLAVRPPWSISENMAFFYRVTESWKKQGHVAQPNAQLLAAIHAEIALFPGTFRASLLTSAVERFAGVEDTEHQKTNGTASSGHHQYDLRTLMGCQEMNTASSGATPAQCSTFMFPLSLDVYTHYDHRNSRAYLSWILNFAFGIYGQLKALEEMIKGKECVRNASKSNPSKCPSLPMCPGVLTALYQSGSSFMDQKQLAEVNKTSTGGTTTTRKTCDDFQSVLSGLFQCDSTYCSPLHNLIVQCEAFLWSIRLPFSLVQLSLWSVAILFISYVFVVPLDHFKIKSHLFNRLKYTMHPSLLIADQQRRVSEVEYFSL